MAGGIFAGHDQGGGEIIKKDGKLYCQFYGMSSSAAMKKHHGAVAEYRYVLQTLSSLTYTNHPYAMIHERYMIYRAAEGKLVEIPYKGDVESTVLDILGGLRSACTYVGAPSLQELPLRTTFVRCSQTLNPVFGQGI